MSDTLRIDNQMMGFAPFSVVDDVVDDVLLIIIVFFRKKDILRAVGNTAPEGDITGIPAITSIMLQRSWEDEVSLTLSIACMAVFTAVSNPIV